METPYGRVCDLGAFTFCLVSGLKFGNTVGDIEAFLFDGEDQTLIGARIMLVDNYTFPLINLKEYIFYFPEEYHDFYLNESFLTHGVAEIIVSTCEDQELDMSICLLHPKHPEAVKMTQTYGESLRRMGQRGIWRFPQWVPA